MAVSLLNFSVSVHIRFGIKTYTKVTEIGCNPVAEISASEITALCLLQTRAIYVWPEVYRRMKVVFDVSKLTVFCVEVYANEEYAFQDIIDDTTQKTTQKTTQSLSNIQIAILEYVRVHPNASRKEISANLNDITEDGVKYHLRKLQKQEFLKRIGPDKGGHWEIIVSNDNV